MTTARDPHETWMAHALELARMRLGRTAPNPSVGCVIVRDGAVIAEAATGEGGRPHAEEMALQLAGDRAHGADVYVSLEPCSQRTTGGLACADRLVAAGVARVFVACPDPNPAAADGISRLRAAGIEVIANLILEDARALNAGFFKRLSTGRPLLVISDDPSSFDAEFDLRMRESFEQALDRLGGAGMTRVYVRPDTPLAAQLTARGLVD